MHAIVDFLNTLVTDLSKIDPAWYVSLTGPLANVAQHYMKRESEFVAKYGTTISLVLAFGSAGLFSGFNPVMHNWLISTGLLGSPVWLISQLLFKNVSKKVEEYNSIKSPAVAVEAAPATV